MIGYKSPGILKFYSGAFEFFRLNELHPTLVVLLGTFLFTVAAGKKKCNRDKRPCPYRSHRDTHSNQTLSVVRDLPRAEDYTI